MGGLSNNQILLKELIKQEYEENNSFDKIESFFEFFAANQILKKYNLSDEEVESGIKGAGNDGGCDGIYIFANGFLISEDNVGGMNFPKETKIDMIIVQAKTTTSFGEDAIMKWKTVSSNLLQMSNDIDGYKARYNEDVRDSFKLFRFLYIKLLRNKIKLNFYYYYITMGTEVHPNVKEQGQELELIVKELFPNCNVYTKFVGADKLMEIINIADIREYNLQMAENPISIGERNDYVALVNLVDYYNFISDEKENIIKNIFESNVRDYQGNVTVNSEIQQTLQQGSEEDFWWLNNGITIIASEIIPKAGKVLTITDPEIVNGLQTSTEIYNYFSSNPYRKDIEKRNILIRALVPSNDECRDKVIMATNNQTSIPKSSLRTTDTIHRQIEMYFKGRGLYYDRRKNYYKNQGKKADDIISVSFLAQCLIAIMLQKPNYSRARPSTLLTNDEYYNKLYVANNDLEVFYNVAYIGRKVNRVLKSKEVYSTVEKGDILFYVMYCVVASVINKREINTNNLKNINLELITDERILLASSKVYNLYSELGGTSQVAKGSVLIERLNTLIKEEYGIQISE